MKGKNLAIANALALTMAILWVLCGVVVLLLPDLSMTVVNSWMHGLDMRTMGEWNIMPGSFILGGLTAVGSSWVVGWIFGWSWDKVNGRK